MITELIVIKSDDRENYRLRIITAMEDGFIPYKVIKDSFCFSTAAHPLEVNKYQCILRRDK